MYTAKYDQRPAVWDERNRQHLGSDHPERRISLQEVDEALADPGRLETHLVEREEYQVLGRTSAGRWLVVVWIDQPPGPLPHSCEGGIEAAREEVDG